MVRAGFFPGIQALRAIAAALVLLQHSIVLTCRVEGIDPAPYLKVGSGHIGVMLFFCISGFVIGLNRHQPPVTFALRRALRIYPGFWLASAVAILLVPGASSGLWTLLLLPTAELNNALAIPYWTLVFEIAFYALFTIALSFKPSDRTLSFAAIIWIGIAQLMYPHFPDKIEAPGWLILLSPYAQLFACGLIACLNLRSLDAVPSQALLALPVAAMAFLSTVTMTPAGVALVYGAAAASLVVLATRSISIPEPLAKMGDASYGIYLLHLPVLVLLGNVLTGSALTAWPMLVWSAMFAVALIVSGAFGLGEHLLHRRMVRWVQPYLAAARLSSKPLRVRF